MLTFYWNTWTLMFAVAQKCTENIFFFSELDTKLGMVVQQNIFTAFDLELTLPYKF